MDEKPIKKTHYPSLMIIPVGIAFVLACMMFGFWHTMLALIVGLYLVTFFG